LGLGCCQSCRSTSRRSLTTDDTSVFFAKTAPDASVLVRIESKLQTVDHARARGAHLLGRFDLIDG